MTRDERISLLAGDELTGVQGREGSHTGTSHGVARVGLPPIFFSDGPVGTRQGKATGMPSPLSLAASFDPKLAQRHAAVVGDEVKKKGNDVVYAPAMNMQRTPLNGRTFEYFGEDPFLAARIAVGWTLGVQDQGVIANAKHFAVNNQEGKGFQPPGTPIGVGTEGSRMLVDARVDERTLREIYLPQFEATVKEGRAGSIMCAYPRVNGDFACENSHLLEDILKGEWGFKGFVLTDYGANKSTAKSLNNGLDLDIWPSVLLQPPLVNLALAGGQTDMATVDEHVRRQLRTLFAFGFFDREAYADDTSQIDQDAHNAEARAIEEKGIVLLKNARSLLPLDAGKLGKVALIGPEADAIKDGGGSSAIDEFRLTTPRRAFEARLGAERVVYDDGSDAAAAAAAARSAEVAVVVVGDRMTEGSDKPCMDLSCGQTDGINREALIESVAAAQPNTVVLLQTGGPVVTPWRDKVPAIVEAWFPGQNGGTAMARVIFGDAEPGGRLPTTFPVSEADLPTAGDPEKYPGTNETVHYKEGVLIGYRWFDERGIRPAYPFGHGLSYSRFRFGGLRVLPARGGYRVSAVVRNRGRRRGTAVPQLYLGLPDPSPQVIQPPRALKGFAKVSLRPRRGRRVRFGLDARSLSYFDPGSNAWRVAPGCYGVMLGASSRAIRMRSTLGIGRGNRARGRRVRVPRGHATIRVALRRGGRAVRGGTVAVRGPGFSRAVRTNRRGRALVRFRADRSGIARVTSTACATRLRLSRPVS